MLESKKTHMPLVGLSYFTVEHKFGTLQRSTDDIATVIEGTHTEITKTDSRDSILYQNVKSFITETVPGISGNF